jgi:hypothetical protein
MKHIQWRSLLPVFAALAIFYALSLLYFSPVLEGRHLVQGDLKNWQGMAQEILEHRDASGEDPLWTGSMFSGMPAYQITVLWTGNLLRFADSAFHGFLPRPASFLFLYLLGMYILMRCMRVDPWLAIVGAVAFGFSSYFFVILEAGHNSKANAIGYMPMVLGATILLFRDKAWWGGALLALFLGLEIAMNHVQVTYYLAIILVLYALAEAVELIRSGRTGELVQRAGIGAVAVLLALACNIGSLWSTWEYGRYTTRGRSELTILPDGSPAAAIRTTGLDRDYVTAWSYGKQESFTLLVPNAKGGASGSIIRSQEDLQAIKDPAFRNAVLQEYQDGGYINSYWGDQRFTSGPVYIGALVVLLMLLSLARAQGPARWWVLASMPLVALLLLIEDPLLAGILMVAYLFSGIAFWRDGLGYALFSGLLLTLVLSWGRNYMPLTDFFLDHVPGYSKFRAVTIILIIVELAAPVLAIRYLDERLRAGAWDRVTEKRDLMVGGGLVLLLLAFALLPTSFFQFISDAEQERYTAQAAAGGEAQVQAFVDDLRQLRVDVFRSDVLRSLGFVVAGLLLLWMHGRGKLGRGMVLGAMGMLVLVDLWVVDKRYVNNEKERGRYLSWEDERASRLPFKPTEADKAILQAEWSPAADAIHRDLLATTKAARADAKGRDRMVGKDEEELLRFAALRRASDHRVLTLADPFNDSKVSYFHKSVGGYHGAKLKRYQELIEFHLSPAIQRVIAALQSGTSIPAMDSLLAREGVLNMLNTRHLIYNAERAPILNTNALGSAWFVDELRWVKDADEEITALGSIDPARTVLVDERERAQVGGAKAIADPSASITLERYASNELRYRSRSAQGGVAVMSAIWYGPDWQAYIDGKPVPHFRANYVLRGIALPAGEHEVVFRLESRSYRTGQNVSMGASLAVLLLVIGALFRRVRSQEPAA